MLWYKAWLETRWRFLIGFALLLCSAIFTVLAYPQVLKLMPLVPQIDVSGEIGRRIKEAAELVREYRGYVWSQWFRQNLLQMWTLFAVLLGTGGLLAQSSGGAALFTLSLPASRNRLVGTRAGIALAELLAMAIVPSLLVPLVSPAIGESYGVGQALVHSLCLFVAGTAFFSLAFLLSTVFPDVWRPALIALFAAGVLGIAEEAFRELQPYSIFNVMRAELYFRTGEVPWLGLFVTAAASGAMLYAAAANIERHDF
jgi:ABC-2 type transport system permease protein